MWINYSTDQKNFTGHIFNIKLEENSHKMSFKALLVKIQQSKNQQGEAQCAPLPPGQLGLIEYSDDYSKISGSLWQCYRDEQALDTNDDIIDFPANNNNSASFKFKQQMTVETGNCGTKMLK